MRTDRGYFSELAVARESEPSQQQAGEWESFVVGSREGFRCAPIGGGCHGEAGDRLTRSRASYVIG